MKTFWCRVDDDSWGKDDWKELSFDFRLYDPEMVAYEFAEYADSNSGGDLTANKDGHFKVQVKDEEGTIKTFLITWDYVIQFNAEEIE